jgi:hypothetical protein
LRVRGFSPELLLVRVLLRASPPLLLVPCVRPRLRNAYSLLVKLVIRAVAGTAEFTYQFSARIHRQ